MNFIRDNILKIGVFLLIAIIVIVVVVSCSNKNGVGIDDSTGYIEMENKLQTAAIKYVKKNQNLLPKTVDQPRKINLDTLVNNRMLNELRALEDSNVKCTGYVDIIKKDKKTSEYRYTPYIKCGKYYETKTIVNYIKDNDKVVVTGEGLYQSNNSYYYRGEYPKNYIVLGERLYRILEITEDNNLKVISTEKTEDSYVWDNRFNSEKDDYYGINIFSKSRLKENLEFLYENTDEKKGEIFFSNTEKEYIVEHDFCVGKRSQSDIGINSESECKETMPLKVGIISLSEYYRTSIDTSCNSVNKQECNNYNFLFSIIPDRKTKMVTLTANADNSYTFYRINYGELETRNAYTDNYLFPVIYLDKNILYKSGTGTLEDPYIVR